jgi:allantoin racemase
MRILIANVNTTASMTEAIGQQARNVANPGTEIVPITPAFGADSIEGNYESYVAAVSVMETIRAYEGDFDALIQAGYGEHGREGLQELFDVPVVDITEAAAATALFLGHKYAVVTTLDRTVPLIEDRLKLAGLLERCASVRASGLAVLDLEKDPAAAIETIAGQAAQAVEVDRAEAICLGCGGMAGLTQRVVERTGVPIIDGVSAAVKIAEGLVTQGLTTSKARTFAPPRPKQFVNWPPTAAPDHTREPSPS